ncbi:NtaA/DmoA family FMN-dependent monooxygenase [Ruegeria sp. Ofav3-42]|uniref:NtaA/DmoA family FMN-dependent monooxygenase n=1 Tax=Ruegeria sp. Ofav3-42 TaxID=2917759 RepID=UPI001EF66C79|nr:NtaA/DmoA family FMN-dependent monooxygenase [Ruegeria sp. Ofav3-42]MCG7521794.1 NtaA/DmoA family FMN-dependent monooxygenase [Ruegeria sp. Ofav3-42]
MGMLHIGMSLAPTWLSGEAWRRPDSSIENFHDPGFAADIAKRAEAAKLDFVFLPDTLYLDPQVLEMGPGFSSMDPTMMMAAIAHETQRIGLLTTVSTTFLPPYVVARQLQTLNRISRGRAGWNVVTALGGHENFGLDAMPPAEERYAHATEFVQVVRSLWNSYPGSAILNDRNAGRYADASVVRPIDHVGEHFLVQGPLNLPAWPGDRIPLVQAGASDAGQDFAAAIADAVFASTPDREAAATLRQSLCARAERQGRAAHEIRLLPGLSLYLADSKAEARDLYQATHARADQARAIARIKAMIGLDLTDWPDDRPITAEHLPPLPAPCPSRTHAELLQRIIRRDSPRLRDLLTCPEVMGSGHWQIVGTVQDAADDVAQWAQAGAIDGFICVPGGSVDSMHLALDELIPALVDRGLFRSNYTTSSFLGHLSG